MITVCRLRISRKSRITTTYLHSKFIWFEHLSISKLPSALFIDTYLASSQLNICRSINPVTGNSFLLNLLDRERITFSRFFYVLVCVQNQKWSLMMLLKLTLSWYTWQWRFESFNAVALSNQLLTVLARSRDELYGYQLAVSTSSSPHTLKHRLENPDIVLQVPTRILPINGLDLVACSYVLLSAQHPVGVDRSRHMPTDPRFLFGTNFDPLDFFTHLRSNSFFLFCVLSSSLVLKRPTPD